MQRWGFAHKTVLTWEKPPPFGQGAYFRNQTEHVLFGIRGEIGTRPAARSISTIFKGALGEHSEKPEELYNIIRAASYPPYGEGFQRKPRPDFTSLFAEPRAEATRAPATTPHTAPPAATAPDSASAPLDVPEEAQP
jgi:N6-adenosine-specific RNA methylase IME4